MTIAFDNETSSNTTQATDITISHTPVGTPAGVLVLISQGSNQADEITGVTYGGTALIEMTGSPFIGTSNENSTLYAYFLGASVPTGTQNAVISPDSSSPRICSVITLTSSLDLEESTTGQLIDATFQTPETANFALLSTTAFVAECFMSGTGNTGAISPLTNWTSRGGMDFGPNVGFVHTYDIIASDDVTAGFILGGGDNVHLYAVAIKESAAGPTGIPIFRRRIEGY